jgi:hypothetical protein
MAQNMSGSRREARRATLGSFIPLLSQNGLTGLPVASGGDTDKGVDSGWVQNSTLSPEDALTIVSQIAVRVDVSIERDRPHA